jgi:hypothetical protein
MFDRNIGTYQCDSWRLGEEFQLRTTTLTFFFIHTRVAGKILETPRRMLLLEVTIPDTSGVGN